MDYQTLIQSLQQARGGTPGLVAPSNLQWTIDNPQYRQSLLNASSNQESGGSVMSDWQTLTGSADWSNPYDPNNHGGYAYGPNNTIWRQQYDANSAPIPGTLTSMSLNDPNFDAAIMAALAVTGANIASANGLLGGGAAASSGGSAVLTPAELAAPVGAGALTPAEISAAIGATPGVSSGLAGAAIPAAGGGGLLSGLGSAASAIGLTPAQLIGGGVGLLGGLSGSGDQQVTNQSKIDPRLEPYVYGQNGLLSSADQWFQANKNGNPLMKQGAQMMADYYSSPNYTQNYTTLSNLGLGLLGSGVAGNPFTSGGYARTPQLPGASTRG